MERMYSLAFSEIPLLRFLFALFAWGRVDSRFPSLSFASRTGSWARLYFFPIFKLTFLCVSTSGSDYPFAVLFPIYPSSFVFFPIRPIKFKNASEYTTPLFPALLFCRHQSPQCIFSHRRRQKLLFHASFRLSSPLHIAYHHPKCISLVLQ